MSHVTYVAIVKAYGVAETGTADPAEQTLYFSTGLGWVSGPADTPANTFFDPRMTQPLDIRRDLFAPGRLHGGSRVSPGEIVLNNADGGLDWLHHASFAGRDIEVYRGDPDAAFPADWECIWTGTMHDGDLDSDALTLRIRDNQMRLDTSHVHETVYAGDSVLPDGLEGVADIAGKAKPLALGTARNVPAVMVNSSKLIYQVSDYPVSTVDDVYDRGVILTAPDFEIQTTPTTDRMRALAFSPTLGTAGRWCCVGGAGQIWTSDDAGVTWTDRSTSGAFGSNAVYGVVWAAGLATPKFVAVGAQSGIDGIATSTDGITWTQRTNGFTGTIYDVADDGTTLVAVANTPGEIYTSSDGVTWNVQTPGGSAGIFGVAFGNNGTWVTVRASEVWYSTDSGVTWTEGKHRFTTTHETVAWGNGRFVSGGNNAAHIAMSLDGITWTNANQIMSDASSSVGSDGVVWSELLGSFCFVGTDVTATDYAEILALSADGLNWTVHDPGFSSGHSPEGVFSTADMVMICGENGTIATIVAPATYDTETDLLDDSLAPKAGGMKAFPSEGLFRLGSPPVGQITADVTVEDTDAEMTAGKLWEKVLKTAGRTRLKLTTDLSAWTAFNAPTITSGVADPFGGTGAFLVDMATTGAARWIAEDLTLLSDGEKTLEVYVKEGADSDTPTMKLYDVTAAANRARIDITSWSSGFPVFTVSAGTLLNVEAVGSGWYRIEVLSTACTAANTNRFEVSPTSYATTPTGDINVFQPRVWDEASAGFRNMANQQDEDDLTAWSVSGTPVVTGSVSDPVGGTGAYSVEDNDGAAIEYPLRSVTFTEDGVKALEFVVRENTHPASGDTQLALWDNTGAATRLSVEVSAWVAGVPTVAASVGTLKSSEYVGNGYWRIRAVTTSVTAANTNQIFLRPASTAAQTGTLDVFRVRAYNSATFVDQWDWMDIERADNDNATVCGDWIGTRPEPTTKALDRIANSIGAWWGVDRAGVYRLRVLKCPSEATNEFTDPNSLTGWTNTRSSDTDAAAVAPDGTTTAAALTEDSTAASSHYVSLTVPWATVDDEIVTWEGYFKAGGREGVRMNLTRRDGVQARIFVDLTTGELTNLGLARRLLDYSVTDAGGGWWQIRIVVDLQSGATAPSLNLFMLDSGGSGTYNGDGTSSIYVWRLRWLKDIAATITDDDMVEPIERLPAPVERHRHRVNYRVNHTVQTDVAGGVSDARRAVLANPHETVEDSDGTILVRSLLAEDREIFTHLDTSAGATTEAARLTALHGVRRERYALTIPLDSDTELLDLGDYVEIIHPRYGLAGGLTFVIAKVETNVRDETLSLEVWG